MTGPAVHSAVTPRELAAILKLLADETRVRILLLLIRHGELHVRNLCDLVGQSQPALSHHLALLRAGRLIDFRREGKFSYYHVTPQRVQEAFQSLFDDLSVDGQTLRFNDYVLTYQPEHKSRSTTDIAAMQNLSMCVN